MHNRFSCAKGKYICETLMFSSNCERECVPQKCQIWQICGYQVCFSSYKYSKTRLSFLPSLRPGPRWGSLRRSLRPLVGWGGGHPVPIPFPLDAFGVSISAPLAPHLSGPRTQIRGYAYDRVGAHNIVPYFVLFKESNKYNLGNWS